MAYFECVIGSAASGGSGADLIVSCTSGFAGSVITCTNGTDTFTQTCPSTSPYEVTFESIPTGTWTISGVSGGQTFTQSVTITDFTASLNDIPDGSTVTPVNDIQIWLHCANIWDKTYTTIAQVLSDTSTLLALISSNNAVDYMARSTSWASSVCANQTAMGYIGNNDYCADKLLSNSTWLTAICNSTYFESVLNVKVPTMTSSTTPSGVVISDSNFTSGADLSAWHTFTGDYDVDSYTLWSASGNLGQNYIGYKFTSACKVRFVKLQNNGPSDRNGVWNQFKIQASNNGTSWTDITQSLTNSNQAAYGRSNYKFVNDTAYLYYRCFITSLAQGGQATCNKLRFYGRA